MKAQIELEDLMHDPMKVIKPPFARSSTPSPKRPSYRTINHSQDKYDGSYRHQYHPTNGQRCIKKRVTPIVYHIYSLNLQDWNIFPGKYHKANPSRTIQRNSEA